MMIDGLIKEILIVINNYSLLCLGIMLLIGYIFGRLCQKIKIPTLTGYIVAGLLMGNSVTGIVSHSTSHDFIPITEVALSFIALTIGSEFQVKKIRQAGSKILIITLFESLCAAFLVCTILTFFLSLPYALLLGAIAAATAPAATVFIVKELEARGEFVDFLFGVVAFDDAVSVILFAVVLSVVSPFVSGNPITVSTILTAASTGLLEIGLSVLLGLICAVVIHVLCKNRSDNESLLICLAILFIGTAISSVSELSALITNMVTGAVLINISTNNRRIFMRLEPLTPPVFALFFILAGTELSFDVIVQGLVVLIGFIYLVVRFSGKFIGVSIGASLVKAPDKVRRYLGFCLFPQAGVAIGLALVIQNSTLMLDAAEGVKELLALVINIVLFSVFVNELVGPLISRFGIVRGAVRRNAKGG